MVSVVHSTVDWLGLTKSWIYDQVRFAPPEVSQTVWCDRRIGGPHDSWGGRVIVEPFGMYNRIARRANTWLERPTLRYRSSVPWRQFDVLMSHFGNRAWHDYQYIRGWPLRKVVRFYGVDVGATPRDPIWMKRYRRLFEEYDAFVCEGPHMAEAVCALGAPTSRVHWLPLGIDPSVIASDLAPIDRLRNPMRILLAATFVEKKGMHLGLKSISDFVAKTGAVVEVTVVGDAAPNDAEQQQIKQLIIRAANEIESHQGCRVHMLGYVPLSRLHELMQRHLVYMAPSQHARSGDLEGGFPVTLTHAAAQGMVLVGSDHCDLPLIVRHEQNGLVCPQGSVTGLTEALERLSQMSANDLERMRIRSCEVVREEFDGRVVGERLYREVLAGD